MQFVIPSRYFYNVTQPARRLGPVKGRQDFDFSNFFDFGLTNPPNEVDSTSEMMVIDETTMMPTTGMIGDTNFPGITEAPVLERPPFSPEEQASYNLAALICKLPKRKLITDAEFLTKQIDYSALNNYVIQSPVDHSFVYDAFESKFILCFHS